MEEIWPKEQIEIENLLYRRVHNQKLDRLDKHKISPSAFKNTPENDTDFSTDWEKYTSAQGVRDLISLEYKTGRTEYKNPKDFYIISLQIKKILELNINQIIEHTPKQEIPEKVGFPNNRAHSSIIGEKTDEEVRLKLAGIANWAINPDN